MLPLNQPPGFSPGSLRVLVVADDLLARAGLAALLTERSDHRIVGQIDARDLLLTGPAYAPDVILWELEGGSIPLDRIPNNAEATDSIDSSAPILALIREEQDIAALWNAGIRGLLLRRARIEQVLAALPAIAQGMAVIDPLLTDTLFAPRDLRPALIVETLTGREQEVLQFMAQGMANKTIARQMNITESTVKFHVNAILGKLGAQSRTDAVVRATRLGLIVL